MLRLYKTFKKSFEFESYIKNISDRKIQKSISQFRLSSHCLRIHTGRQERDKTGKNTPADKRFCLNCKSGKIDDELHLITSCETHNAERTVLFSNISTLIDLRCPASELLPNILNSEDKTVTHEFGKFLNIAFMKRKSAK